MNIAKRMALFWLLSLSFAGCCNHKPTIRHLRDTIAVIQKRGLAKRPALRLRLETAIRLADKALEEEK